VARTPTTRVRASAPVHVVLTGSSVGIDVSQACRAGPRQACARNSAPTTLRPEHAVVHCGVGAAPVRWIAVASDTDRNPVSPDATVNNACSRSLASSGALSRPQACRGRRYNACGHINANAGSWSRLHEPGGRSPNSGGRLRAQRVRRRPLLIANFRRVIQRRTARPPGHPPVPSRHQWPSRRVPSPPRNETAVLAFNLPRPIA